jgi:hypothetical protein
MPAQPVPYGPDGHVFSLPEVPYGFIAASHTFWGAGTAPHMGASITAQMDADGHVLSGSVLAVGGVPAKNIPDGSLLLVASVLWVDIIYVPSHFWAGFVFKIAHSHPGLGYQSPLGVWQAFFRIDNWTAADQPKLFRIGWGPARTPVNSYVGQVKCFY